MTPGQQPGSRLEQNVVSIHLSETRMVDLHRRHGDGRVGRSLSMLAATDGNGFRLFCLSGAESICC